VGKNLEPVAPLPDLSQKTNNDPREEFPAGEYPRIPKQRGAHKVLLGFIDVDGFDFSHREFLDEAGKTRFVRIWDQRDTGNAKVPSKAPPPARRGAEWGQYKYGHEFGQAVMNEALATAIAPGWAWLTAGMPTHAFGAHGTHVASIAGGSTMGLCPDAYLAGVVYAQGPGANGPTASPRARADSERLQDALSYLQAVARELGDDVALVINISLVRNGGAHDGSDSICRAIEALTTGSGFCVVVAAGNAGDSSEVGGRIHASGTIARGERKTLAWRVGPSDPTDNEMEIWYDRHDTLAVSVVSPDGKTMAPVPADSSGSMTLADGTSAFVHHTSYDAANGSNYVYLRTSPNKGTYGAVVAPGDWKIHLSAEGSKAESGPFHAWIERDDEDNLRHQSCFVATNPGEFDHTKINSLACGANTIAVANWDARASRPHPSSSQGPTRDGRHKPDISAPGTDIWGANGFPIQEGDDLEGSGSPLARPYACRTGTSMATSYVSGVAALMLQLNPVLTAAQIRAIMTRTADGGTWTRDKGYGPINLDKCLDEARRLGKLGARLSRAAHGPV
jgi:subtilisin family serine protease